MILTRARMRQLLLGIALACALPAVARAQIKAALTTQVEVLFPPLTATGVHALQFGLITPGATSLTVNPRTLQGGEMRVTGTKTRKSLDVTFTLPTVLTNANGKTIPINFNGNYAAICELDNTGACVTASYYPYNPVTTPSFHDTPQRYQPGRPTYTYDTYAVYIGGQILPTATQAAGNYSANISITLVIN